MSSNARKVPEHVLTHPAVVALVDKGTKGGLSPEDVRRASDEAQVEPRHLKGLLEHLDMEPHLVPRNLFVGDRIPLAGVAHQNGTIRFGRDPKTSALNQDCRAHEVDNLYVVDASFFPSSGAVNPALTIMANALRVGDRLLERLGATTTVMAEAGI